MTLSFIFPGCSFGIPISIVHVQSTGSFSTLLHDLLLWSFFHPDIRRSHTSFDNCQKLAMRGILFSIRLMTLDRYLYHCIFSFELFVFTTILSMNFRSDFPQTIRIT
jgi:hypothetical protein